MYQASNTNTVCLIATLDTKYVEAMYLKEKLESFGLRVIVIDVSTKNAISTTLKNTIPPTEVAKAGGFSFEEVSRLPRRKAIEVMAQGLKKILGELYGRGAVDGVIAIGGADGASLAASAMREMPIGIPKIIVSPIFQGHEEFGPFVGTKDIVLIHSVVDVVGINTISRIIFDNAAAALAGMVLARSKSSEDQGRRSLLPGDRSIAATMYGNTTPGVMKAKTLLEREGFEVIVFHPNGTGGRAMEELIEQGYFIGVLDYTPHEIVDELFGGLHRAGPHRLEAAGRKGIPQVILPGCLDFILMGSYDTLPSDIKKSRLLYAFNPLHTLVKISKEEAAVVGRYVADKLNRARGPTAVVFPLRGLSMYDIEGGPFHDPEITLSLLKSLKEGLRQDIPLIEVDAHINDDKTATIASEVLLAFLKR